MFDKNQAIELSEQMSGSLKIMNEIEFSDMDISVPSINFYHDSDQFLDSQSNEIHIGIFGILDLFHPKDENEFLSALNYVRGHESQHRRSTVPKCYSAAIAQGTHAVIRFIQQKVEGTKRRFRNENDYRICMDDIKKKYGLYISWDKITSIVAGIANSVEDGRIERIRSNRFPGFGNLRMVFRGIFWDNSAEEYQAYENIEQNIAEKLRILINEILMLATCQLHCKGFLMAYGDTPLYDEVKQFIPHIGQAVMSGNARGIVEPVTNICDLLAPYIFEVAKMSKEDVKMQQAFEDMIKDLIKSLIESMPLNCNFDLSENDEDNDDGSANSTFPQSDLIITLSDEEYDELIKKTNQDNADSEGGIMIRREHPLESQKEAKDKNTTSDSASENHSLAKEEQENNNLSNDANNNDSDNTDTNCQQTSALSGHKKEDSKSSSDVEMPTKNAKNSTEHDVTNDNDADNSDNPNQKASNSKNVQNSEKEVAKKHVGKDKMNEAEEQVKKAMQEAANAVKAEAEKNIEACNVNTAKGAKEAKKRQKVDVMPPISSAEMKDICDFQELKRAYKVHDNLPSVLAQRGKVLKRKNEQYFKSLSTPNVSYLDSGNIDPSRIYALSFGDTEVFKKNGKDKKFDGCAYMLIDNSGSMYGQKRTEACKAAAVIEEGFKGIMPLKIVAFDVSGCVIHEVVKNWDENLNKNCCWNFCLHGRNGSGNEDGYDIQIAERELLSRPEQKKMMIVLSDGTPGNTEYCKKAIEHARKAGIQVYGIYFEEGDCRSNRYFEGMYQKDYVCCPLCELDANLTKIFKKFSRS